MTEQDDLRPTAEVEAASEAAVEASGTLHWLRLLLGLGLGVAVAVAVILLVSPHVGKDIQQATRAATRPVWLLVVLLSLATLLLADAGSLVILVRALCGRVSSFKSGEVAFESHLVGGATSFGGLEIPYQMYLLHRLGMSLSEASSVVLIKGLVHTSVLAAVATVALLPLGISSLTQFQRDLLLLVVGGLAIIWALGALWLARPLGLGLLPQSFRRRVDEFREAIRTLRAGGLRLIAPLVGLQLVYWLFMFALIPLILHSLGWRGDLAPIIVGQAVLQILMPFSPLPGGAGVAEFGYLELIGQSVPADLVVPSLVLWRLCTWFIPMGLGAIGLGLRGSRRQRKAQVPAC